MNVYYSFIESYLVRNRIRGSERSLKFPKSLSLVYGKRGQFIIIASLLIGVLVLSLAIGVNEMGLQRQELSYKPLRELIYSITSDANRALITALRKGTEDYNSSFWDDSFPRNHEEASNRAYRKIENFMSLWTRSVLTSYSSHGIQLKIPFEDQDLFDKNIDWRSQNGRSKVKMYFSINFTAEGFSGWEGELVNMFSLNVPFLVSGGENITTFIFQLCKWTGELGRSPPFYISDLKEWDLKIAQKITTEWEVVNVSKLEYLGEGLYKVNLTQGLCYGSSVKMLVVVPEDQVLVGASTEVGREEPWNELFFEHPYILSPIFHASPPPHLHPLSKGYSSIRLSTVNLTSFNIRLEDYVLIKMLLERSPPKAEIESVEVKFGYNNSGVSTTIASYTYTATSYGGSQNLIDNFSQGMRLYLADDQNRNIPQNSIIWLYFNITPSKEPYGTTKIMCGPAFDSSILLLIPPEIYNVSWSYNVSQRIFSVEATVTDIGYGDSAIAGARFMLKNATDETEWCDMDDVDGNYYQDREVRVNGTITIPNDWVSGDYVLLIEAYDDVGSRKSLKIEINYLDLNAP